MNPAQTALARASSTPASVTGRSSSAAVGPGSEMSTMPARATTMPASWAGEDAHRVRGPRAAGTSAAPAPIGAATLILVKLRQQ